MLLRQRRFSTEARPAAVNAAAAGVRGFVRIGEKMVPLAGIEPALLAELDFESSASTSSATGAFAPSAQGLASRSRRNIAAGFAGSTRADVKAGASTGAVCRVTTRLLHHWA